VVSWPCTHIGRPNMNDVISKLAAEQVLEIIERLDSDVDLFFDYERGKVGLYELMDVKEPPPRFSGRRPTS
jgi:hypothetical protein